MEVGCCFDVDGDVVGSGVDKFGDVAFRLGDHEVAVECDADGAAECGDDGEADADVGDEYAVHDVDVERVGTSVLGFAGVFSEPCEVG